MLKHAEKNSCETLVQFYLHFFTLLTFMMRDSLLHQLRSIPHYRLYRDLHQLVYI